MKAVQNSNSMARPLLPQGSVAPAIYVFGCDLAPNTYDFPAAVFAPIADQGDEVRNQALERAAVDVHKPSPALRTSAVLKGLDTKRRNIVIGEQERIGRRWTSWLSSSLQPI